MLGPIQSGACPMPPVDTFDFNWSFRTTYSWFFVFYTIDDFFFGNRPISEYFSQENTILKYA